MGRNKMKKYLSRNYKTYTGEPASDSYKVLKAFLDRHGFETLQEYLKEKCGKVVKDEWRIKDRYEECDPTAVEIPNIPGYFITPDAVIWKYSPKFKSWITISQQTLKSGYMTFQPYIDKKRFVKYVHRELLNAHRGYRDISYEAHHVDRDRQNNNLSNLRWVEYDEHRRMWKTKKKK